MHAPFGPCSDHLRLHALHSHLTFDFSQCRRRIRRLSRSSPPCCTSSATSSTPTRWFRPRRHAPKHAATARRSSTCSARRASVHANLGFAVRATTRRAVRPCIAAIAPFAVQRSPAFRLSRACPLLCLCRSAAQTRPLWRLSSWMVHGQRLVDGLMAAGAAAGAVEPARLTTSRVRSLASPTLVWLAATPRDQSRERRAAR